MTKSTIPVIFRKFKCGGDIIAIFPTIAADANVDNCQSYQHVGQHGACSLGLLSDGSTLPAKTAEYADLLSELVNVVGYVDLKIMKRASFKMRLTRILL